MVASLLSSLMWDAMASRDICDRRRLVVEARPTAYDDEMFDLQMTYYEEGSTGKRVIGRMGQMGPIARAPVDPSSLDRRGNGSTVVTGSKGYAVEVSVQVEPL